MGDGRYDISTLHWWLFSGKNDYPPSSVAYRQDWPLTKGLTRPSEAELRKRFRADRMYNPGDYDAAARAGTEDHIPPGSRVETVEP